MLCKWLTLAVLAENQTALVARLDGETANTAEFLTLHCEMIGVPVDRFWRLAPEPADLTFVDLPGVEAGGANEGLIGSGFALGPAAGLIGLALAHALGGRQIGMLLGLGPVLVVCAVWAAVKFSRARGVDLRPNA